jgi:hypothetical protein
VRDSLHGLGSFVWMYIVARRGHSWRGGRKSRIVKRLTLTAKAP